jgi:hypothetical protein
MTQAGYAIHGVGVRIVTDSPDIMEAADVLLRRFRCGALAGPADLGIRLLGVAEPAAIPFEIPPSARRLFHTVGMAADPEVASPWKWDVYVDGPRRIFDFHEQGLLVVAGQTAEGYLVAPESMHRDVVICLLHIALTELLKGRGLYTIHATALDRGGRVVLIPGASGRGKTTACVSLLRSGYGCMSDDHPLLRDDGDALTVLSFPVKVDVTPGTVRFFPELSRAGAPLHQGLQKRYFHPEDIYPHRSADAGEPALILLPQIVDVPRSRLEPYPKSRALEALLPQSLLVFDKEIAQRHFRALARLVERTPCYRLHFGRDVCDLPRLVDPLLDGAGAGS